MPGLAEIRGHEAPIAVLRRWLASGRVPRSLLFRGPEGVGKRTVARLFAAALLCERADGSACGECASCGALERGNHPDVLRVTLAPRESDGEIRKVIVIEQIRELGRLAGIAPRLTDRRIFIVDPADRMNVEAQNSLLKTLEEPPGRAVLILVATRPHLLLPTVRSRCSGIGFSALRSSELTRLLRERGVPEDEVAVRAALSGGRPGVAIELDLDRLCQRREDLLQMLESLTSAGAGELARLPEMAAALAGKEESELVAGLEMLQSLLRDTARSATEQHPAALVHVDLASRLAALGRRLGGPRAADLVTAIDRARGRLRINANRTLLTESLLADVVGYEVGP